MDRNTDAWFSEYKSKYLSEVLVSRQTGGSSGVQMVTFHRRDMQSSELAAAVSRRTSSGHHRILFSVSTLCSKEFASHINIIIFSAAGSV